MGSVVMENCTADVDENQDAKGSRSAENFQKFMYELFEKNGVMNDLRSYLRGHIVNVLRSAQTGDPPSCQKHFTQRLELTFQALNILIAEYLLRLEFSYTLSVFVSEIPLANMVFSYAKTLMKQVDNDDSRPRFKDSDVWCILNYLGVKCDSDHASSIVEMYRLERNSPLLLCILKSAPLFKEPIVVVPMNTSQESLSSSVQSSESVEAKPRSPERKPSFQEKCRHYAFCKTCQRKMVRIKEKYRKKKEDIAKNLKESSVNSLNVDSLMKNISSMERSLIDEMFEQLKSVYEAEMDLMKDEEDKRVKRSLATHSTQLRKRRDEMEESFKAREAELESNVQQKKRFLWGLARALREQHHHMTRAMHDVRAETSRLSAKEDSLKSQLAEAEQILRKRGEDMRQQISAELAVLESHLESMKRERDNINRERKQLDQYKDHSTLKHIENEDLKPHYDLLRDELAILKKYLETAKLEPKCVMERSTLTDLHDVTSRIDVVLNNEQDVERRSEEDRVKPKQLVNDLKKAKNVNFSQSNLDEIYRERSRSRSRSSASSEAGDATFGTEQDSMQRLRDENEHLRCFSRQQREHIDSMLSQQARLQAELTAARVRPAPPRAPPRAAARPSTAPSPALHALDAHAQRMSASASVNNFSYGWRKGAGEELSFFANPQPRIVVPGEAIPFVGVVTRHTDNRRYLINQWRSLRRRISPLCGGGVSKLRASSPIQRNLRDRPETAGPSVRLHLDQVENETANQVHADIENAYQPEEYHRPTSVTGDRRTDVKTREKSPKSVLREAKEKLRNKDTIKDFAPTVREKSPNCVLREAKLRLRKLEIEAEAVEQSYLDFRRKQESFRDERQNPRSGEMKDSVANIGAKDSVANIGAKDSVANIGAKDSVANIGAKDSVANIGAKDSVANIGAKDSVANIGAKDSVANIGAKDSVANIGAKDSVANIGAKDSVANIGAKDSVANIGAKDSVANIGAKDSVANIGAKDSVANIGAKDSVANIGAKDSVANIGAKDSVANIGAKDSVANIGAKDSVANIGAKDSVANIGAKDSVANIGAKDSVANIGAKDSVANIGAKDSVANIGAKDLDTKPSTSTYKLDQTYKESTSHCQEPKPTNDYDKYFKEYQTKFGLGEHFMNKNTAAFRLNPIPDAYSIQEAKKPRNYIETPLTEFRKFYHSDRRFSNEFSRPKSPKPVSDSEKSMRGTRKEVIRQAKNDQVKELEILKHNIGKIYNMPEQAIVETPPINADSNNEIYEEWVENQQPSAVEQNSIENDAVEVESKSVEDRNLLRIEVESVSGINDVKVTESQSQDMLLIIESSVDNNRDSEISDTEINKDKFSTQMSIIVSPTRKSIPNNEGLTETLSPRNESGKSEVIKSPRNLSMSESIKSSKIGSTKSSRKDTKSPILDCGNSRRGDSVKSEKNTTDDVVAIYHDDNDNISSVQMRLDLSKDVLDNTMSELEQNEDPDYPDDFSADVDNYNNSRSDYGNQSPISLPKTSEDENFWED